MTDQIDPANSNRGNLIAWLTPIVLLGLMVVIYLVSPKFYLQYVLEEKQREYQFVEIVTVISAFLASFILAWCAVRLWRQPIGLLDAAGTTASAGGLALLLRRRGAVMLIGVVGLASFFFAGEEISWGQTYFRWGTPEGYQEISGETNLHNAKLPISVNSLGSIFIYGYFVVLPLLWLKRKDIGLPEEWAPAIPEWPVVSCVGIATLWKVGKGICKKMAGITDDLSEPIFYRDFVEQFNEHKEMLIGVALLMFAIYRIKAIRNKEAM